MNEQEYRKEPEDKMNLKQKLVEIRKSVEYVQKTEFGNQGAMYVDPAVILRKIRLKMDEYGVLLHPEITEPEINQIDMPTAKNQNNKGFFTKNVMLYTWLDAESEDKITVPWFATGQHMQDPAMAFGASLTYSERYFLLKYFQIPTSKDDPEYFKGKADPIKFVSDEQIANIKAMIEETRSNEAKFCEVCKVRSIGEIQARYYNNAIQLLEKKRENNKS